MHNSFDPTVPASDPEFAESAESADSAVKDSVEQRFAALADRYARSGVHSRGPDLRAMVEAGARRGDEHLLDVGCGPGHTALAFAPRVGRVVGVDLAEPMLEQGRRLASERDLHNVEFRRGDVEALPFESDAFDVVASRHSAHHYPDPRRALAEVARVLAPGGLFLLVDAVAPEDPASDSFLNALELIRDPSHVRDHRASEWLDWMGAAGFVPELLERWPLRLEFDSWVTRSQTPPAGVAALHYLQAGASREARDAFELAPPASHDFTLPIALLSGRLPA